VLADGFEETEAVATIDIIRRGGVQLDCVGLSERLVRGAHDIHIQADFLWSEYDAAVDAIILPGGMPGTLNLAASPSLVERIGQLHAQGKLCAAICAAPQVLAKAGILQGRRASCYPGVEQKLVGCAVQQQDVVVDGTIITSRGVGTTLAFGLAIVRYLRGDAVADEVSEKILFE
jgi:4-methyl-5(b-hydroxyethyl)-thiazole monophosphate biosynthesis